MVLSSRFVKKSPVTSVQAFDQLCCKRCLFSETSPSWTFLQTEREHRPLHYSSCQLPSRSLTGWHHGGWHISFRKRILTTNSVSLGLFVKGAKVKISWGSFTLIPFLPMQAARKSYSSSSHLRTVGEKEVGCEPWHILDNPLLLWKEAGSTPTKQTNKQKSNGSGSEYIYCLN